tara:strand:+ start:6708 stop:8111 length:1404 start_codon:yes stop_codon:yes gene_type:complete
MPLIDLANPLNSQGLQQIAGPFGSLLGPGAQFPQSYDFAKRFVQTRKTFEGGGNGVTSVDDPTYLGFNIRFDVASPLFNGAEKGLVVSGAGEISSEDNSSGDIPQSESAVGYLTVRGEATAANYLRAFVQGMLQIQRTRPYYFQTIDGLDAAFTKTTDLTDPYMGVADTEGITIGMLEALDLKMSALFNLYKMAAFDVKYKRLRIPKNLLKFNVYIDVLEMRKFKTVRNYLGALAPEQFPADETLRVVNENTSVITFKFSQCMFDVAASGKVFESVTNIADPSNFAVSAMKWTYGKVEMEAQFSGFDSKLMDAKPQPVDPNAPSKLEQTVKQFAKDQIANQAAGAINALERGASSFIQNFTLGNVYGVFNKLKDKIANPQGLINSLNGAAVQALDSEQSSGSTPQNLGDNPFPNPQIQPGNSEDIGNKIFTSPPEEPIANQDSVGGNIFGPAPSGPPLESSNIFEGQ